MLSSYINYLEMIAKKENSFPGGAPPVFHFPIFPKNDEFSCMVNSRPLVAVAPLLQEVQRVYCIRNRAVYF